MKQMRGKLYWLLLLFCIFLLIGLIIYHQQAAAEMAANPGNSFTLRPPLDPYDPGYYNATRSQQSNYYQLAWMIGFLIPACLMLISYFVHGCFYYNDKLSYIDDHERPSGGRALIQLFGAFMILMVTGTTVWNTLYTFLMFLSPVLFCIYPFLLIFFFNSGTVLCHSILIPAKHSLTTMQ